MLHIAHKELQSVADPTMPCLHVKQLHGIHWNVLHNA